VVGIAELAGFDIELQTDDDNEVDDDSTPALIGGILSAEA
jgi:hypothetical protein